MKYYTLYSFVANGYVSTWKMDNKKRVLVFNGNRLHFPSVSEAVIFLDTCINGGGPDHNEPNPNIVKTDFVVHEYGITNTIEMR